MEACLNLCHKTTGRQFKFYVEYETYIIFVTFSQFLHIPEPSWLSFIIHIHCLSYFEWPRKKWFCSAHCWQSFWWRDQENFDGQNLFRFDQVNLQGWRGLLGKRRKKRIFYSSWGVCRLQEHWYSDIWICIWRQQQRHWIEHEQYTHWGKRIFSSWGMCQLQ